MHPTAQPRLLRAICGGVLGAAVVVTGPGGSAPAEAADPGRPPGPHCTPAPRFAPHSVRTAFPVHGPAPGASAPEPAAGNWTRPVSRGEVSAAYGIAGRWQAGHHTGVDLALPVGTPVYSVGPGTVTAAGWAGSYGYRVKIRTADGHWILYAHLQTIWVAAGDRVSAGTLIGRSGNTGRSSGPHLHFEVRDRPGYGSDIDPVAYLRRRGVTAL